MPKEILIYSSLHRFTAEIVVRELNRIPENEDFKVRLNTPGGETTAGFSILSKMSELTGEKTAIIDGEALSMGAFMLPFFDKVIANNTSEITFHKASYPSWHTPTEAEAKKLKSMNALFESQLRSKVGTKPGGAEFLNKLFEPDIINDVMLTPAEAKKIGIVDEVRILKPTAYSGMQIVAMFDGPEVNKEANTIHPNLDDNNNLNNNNMTLAELQSKHPALYAEIFKAGEKAGAEVEKDRAGAWLAFVKADPEAVVKGIKEGEPLSQTAMAEFSVKMLSATKVKEHKDDNAPETDAEKAEKATAKAEADRVKAEMDADLEKVGIKTKKSE